MPPALLSHPSFTAEYWSKAPRQQAPAHIERVTNRDGGWVEIVLKEGARFMRRKDEIKQLLTANLAVEVETFSSPAGRMVTGLFVPGIGWAFRMTAQDLADYARDVATAEWEREQQLKNQIVEHVAKSILTYFGHEAQETDHTPGEYVLSTSFVPQGLAAHIVAAMEKGPE